MAGETMSLVSEAQDAPPPRLQTRLQAGAIICQDRGCVRNVRGMCGDPFVWTGTKTLVCGGGRYHV